MPQKSRRDQTKHIHAAALALAAKGGWGGLTLADIAARAKVPQAELAARYGDIWDIAADILTAIDQSVRKDVSDRLGESWRDNVFELLMTRFEQMQPHRGAFVKILPSAAKSPCAAPRLARRLARSMEDVRAVAGMRGGPFKPVAVGALSVLYLSLVDVWAEDDTADMAKTMAALDKRLGWLAEFLRLEN